MKDRVAVPGGADFSPTDIAMIGQFYPLLVVPPPPPPIDGYTITIRGIGGRPTITTS